MERETGFKGGRRQEMGLERTEGRTPDSKQRKMKRVRNQRPALRAMAGGVEMSKGGRCHPVPEGALAERLVWEFVSEKVPDLSFCCRMSLGAFLK